MTHKRPSAPTLRQEHVDADQEQGNLGTPIFLTQETVREVIGVPPREYMRAAREGLFPSTKLRRKILARTADVIAFLEARLAKRAPLALVTEATALARVGARRVAP